MRVRVCMCLRVRARARARVCLCVVYIFSLRMRNTRKRVVKDTRRARLIYELMVSTDGAATYKTRPSIKRNT